MHARNLIHRWWPILLLIMTAGGCASTGAPDGWLPVANEAPQDPYGAWVTVEYVKTHSEQFLVGEFLAVDADSLYVLNPYLSGDPVVGVSHDLINKARVASFDPETGQASGWVMAGTFSTLSHGLGAAITAPLWIMMGSAMVGGHSRSALDDFPDQDWAELRKFARFPQGPPPEIHQLGLVPKPQNQPMALPEKTPDELVY